MCFFFFSSRRRHTRYWRDWSSDVCSSDLSLTAALFVRALLRAGADWRFRPAAVRAQLVLGRDLLLRATVLQLAFLVRSGERRVGEECRFRGSPVHLKKKNHT